MHPDSVVHASTNAGYSETAIIDSAGKATLLISNKAFPLTLYIHDMAMEQEKIVLVSPGNYSVNVVMRRKKRWQMRRIESGEIYEYKIKERSGNKIVMRRRGKGKHFVYTKSKF